MRSKNYNDQKRIVVLNHLFGYYHFCLIGIFYSIELCKEIIISVKQYN